MASPPPVMNLTVQIPTEETPTSPPQSPSQSVSSPSTASLRSSSDASDGGSRDEVRLPTYTTGASQLPGEVVRPRAKPSVTRKHLAPQNFSLEEDRPDVLDLDYTAITTANPIDLRHKVRAARVVTKYAIGITVGRHHTMEDLRASLVAVGENMRPLATSSAVPWEAVVVCVMVDGVDMAPDVKEYLTTDLKLFDGALLRESRGGRPTSLHLFERTVELAKHTQAREVYDPLQVVLGVLPRPRGHLHTELWFLSGLCHQLDPVYTTVLSAGVAPELGALPTMLNAMARSPRVGAVSPDIHVAGLSLFNPLHAAQFFERKLDGVLNKASQSTTGYITELAPECLTLRWAAVKGCPIGAYFATTEKSLAEMGPVEANRHVAPTRVLAWEALTHPSAGYSHHYAGGARVHVPAPADLMPFLEHGRQAANGRTFNTIHSLVHGPGLLCGRSALSLPRRLAILLQCTHLCLELLVNWVGAGTYFLALHTLADRVLLGEDFQLGKGCFYGITLLFTIATVAQVVSGLGVHLADLRVVHWVAGAAHGVVFFLMAVMGLYAALNSIVPLEVVYGVGGGVGLLLLLFAAHGQLYSGAKTALQFLLCIPVFAIMVPVYAITHSDNTSNRRALDMSPWDATTHNIIPGDGRVDAVAVQRRFLAFRTRLLGLWLVANWVWVSFWLYFGFEDLVPWGLGAFVAYMLVVRAVGSVMHAVAAGWRAAWRFLGCCYRTPGQQLSGRRCCGSRSMAVASLTKTGGGGPQVVVEPSQPAPRMEAAKPRTPPLNGPALLPPRRASAQDAPRRSQSPSGDGNETPVVALKRPSSRGSASSRGESPRHRRGVESPRSHHRKGADSPRHRRVESPRRAESPLRGESPRHARMARSTSSGRHSPAARKRVNRHTTGASRSSHHGHLVRRGSSKRSGRGSPRGSRRRDPEQSVTDMLEDVDEEFEFEMRGGDRRRDSRDSRSGRRRDSRRHSRRDSRQGSRERVSGRDSPLGPPPGSPQHGHSFTDHRVSSPSRPRYANHEAVSKPMITANPDLEFALRKAAEFGLGAGVNPKLPLDDYLRETRAASAAAPRKATSTSSFRHKPPASARGSGGYPRLPTNATGTTRSGSPRGDRFAPAFSLRQAAPGYSQSGRF